MSKYLRASCLESFQQLPSLWRPIVKGEFKLICTKQGETKGFVVPAIDAYLLAENPGLESTDRQSLLAFCKSKTIPEVDCTYLLFRNRIQIAWLHPRFMPYLDLPLIGKTSLEDL